ncbi:MAG TPA: hypothetical protein VKW08_03490 [Xanthobacteraceae bacterium]|nr:hypothetical protein [Xanthobacteraceae bacterium]
MRELATLQIRLLLSRLGSRYIKKIPLMRNGFPWSSRSERMPKRGEYPVRKRSNQNAASATKKYAMATSAAFRKVSLGGIWRDSTERLSEPGVLFSIFAARRAAIALTAQFADAGAGRGKDARTRDNTARAPSLWSRVFHDRNRE